MYKPYPKYKKSGVAWLGDVPEGWTIAGFKKYFEKIVDYRGKTPEKVDNGIFLVTARNIKNGIINYSLSSEYVKEEDYNSIMSRGKPEIGDVLFTTEAPLGEVANIDNVDIALAQRVIKFRGKKGILDNYYLKYFMMSSNFQSSLMIFATGSTALGIKAERLVYLRQLIPPLKEQTQIANYLDQKTKKIDTLIKKQQTLIELLKEKRQALISHVVTKGLDDSVAMKDSGIAWLGDVPEGWKMSKLKFDSYIKARVGWHGLKSDELLEKGDAFVITGSDFFENTIDWKNCRKCTLDRYNQDKYIQLKDNDLLVTKDGTIGKIIKVNKLPQIATLNSGVFVIRPLSDNYLSEYYYWLLISSIFHGFISYYKTGSTILHLYQATFEQMPYPLPPLKEQQKIANHLDQKTKQIDTLIEKSTKAIELLKERRVALVSAVVSGKVDVRDYEK